MDKIIRKPNPSFRKRNIQVVTLKNVENFLNNQSEPIFKSEIVRQIGVDYNSLKVALEMLPIKVDKDGRISIIKKEVKNV